PPLPYMEHSGLVWAIANLGAKVRLAEGHQKVIRRSNGYRHRLDAWRIARNFEPHLRSFTHRIVKRLGDLALQIETGVIGLVVLISRMRHRRYLVRAGVENDLDQLFQVVFLPHQSAGQGVQQRLIAGRVGDPKIVNGFYDPATQVVFPDAVGNGSREPRIFGGSNPIGQRFTQVFTRTVLDNFAGQDA